MSTIGDAARLGTAARERPARGTTRLARVRRASAGSLVTAAWAAVLVPGILAFTTISLYLGRASLTLDGPTSGRGDFLAGLLLGLAVWLGLSVCLRRVSRVGCANPHLYAELGNVLLATQLRLDALPSRLRRRPEAHTAAEHLAHVDAALASTTPSIRWAFGSGYVDLSRHLHRADEALLSLAPDDALVCEAIRDLESCDGSRIAGRDLRISRLEHAVASLDPCLEVVSDPRRARPRHGFAQPLAPAIARRLIVQSRRALNEFRDHGRDGLVRARSSLGIAVLVTGILVYLLVALAVVDGVDRRQLTAGVAFYLIAGSVGLFRQLYVASTRESVGEEDFGLGYMRLVHTPLLCGIAGVAGVFLVSAVGTNAGMAGASRTLPTLTAIFDLGRNETGLVIAAAFGIAPNFLLMRLQQQAASFQSDLRSSTPTAVDGADPRSAKQA